MAHSISNYVSNIAALMDVFFAMLGQEGLTLADDGVSPSMAIGELFGLLSEGWQTQTIVIDGRGSAFKLFKEGFTEGLINPEKKAFYRTSGSKEWLPMPDGKGETLKALRALRLSKSQSIETPQAIQMCRMLAGIALKVCPQDADFIADLRKGKRGTADMVHQALLSRLTVTDDDAQGEAEAFVSGTPQMYVFEAMVQDQPLSPEMLRDLAQAVEHAFDMLDGGDDLFEDGQDQLEGYLQITEATFQYLIAERKHAAARQ